MEAAQNENLPNDPESLLKLYEQMESGATDLVIDNKEGDQEGKEADDDTGASDSADSKSAKQNGETKDSASDDGASEEDADGVATKDGKHIIPFSVLKSARERAERAEQLAKEAEDRVKQLTEQLERQGSNNTNEGVNNGESARTGDNLDDLSADDLELLKSDFPTVFKAIETAMAKVAKLEAKFKPVEDTVQEQQNHEAETVKHSVQEAIDSVPKLAHIQATDQEAFALAKKFDAQLRELPFWQDKPLSERFHKVAEMVEDAMGIEIKVPTTNKSPSISADELGKAARAKASQATKSAGVPTSLSQFPAGAPAAVDEMQALEQLTTLQMADKFANLTPEQLDAYLSKIN